MKARIIVLAVALALVSGCSIFKRDKTGYEDSDSVADLSVPPELDRPKRDKNFDIPDAPDAAAAEQAKAEVAEKVESAAEEVAEELAEDQ